MEFNIGQIYMAKRVEYRWDRYIYIGNNLLFRFGNTEEWYGSDTYILRSYTFGLGDLQECQDTFHLGWVKTFSGYLPLLYLGPPSRTLVSLDEVMDWICSPEGFDERGEKEILPGVILQKSDDGHIHYDLSLPMKNCPINPWRILEDMNGQA